MSSLVTVYGILDCANLFTSHQTTKNSDCVSVVRLTRSVEVLDESLHSIEAGFVHDIDAEKIVENDVLKESSRALRPRTR